MDVDTPTFIMSLLGQHSMDVGPVATCIIIMRRADATYYLSKSKILSLACSVTIPFDIVQLV